MEVAELFVMQVSHNNAQHLEHQFDVQMGLALQMLVLATLTMDAPEQHLIVVLMDRVRHSRQQLVPVPEYLVHSQLPAQLV